MNDELMLQYLMQMGALGREAEAISQQRAMADALREQGGAMGQQGMGMAPAGGRSPVQYAASPMVGLAGAAMTGMGAYGQHQAQRRQAELAERRRKAMEGLMSGGTGRGVTGQPVPAADMPYQELGEPAPQPPAVPGVMATPIRMPRY